jgi:hypothetical protein
MATLEGIVGARVILTGRRESARSDSRDNLDLEPVHYSKAYV